MSNEEIFFVNQNSFNKLNEGGEADLIKIGSSRLHYDSAHICDDYFVLIQRHYFKYFTRIFIYDKDGTFINKISCRDGSNDLSFFYFKGNVLYYQQKNDVWYSYDIEENRTMVMDNITHCVEDNRIFIEIDEMAYIINNASLEKYNYFGFTYYKNYHFKINYKAGEISFINNDEVIIIENYKGM